MDKAELIKHEIEKRIDHNLAIGNPLFTAMAEEDIELLSFINSLQEEPVNDGLEDAANKYIKGRYSPWLYKAMVDCFKAGAEWQKKLRIK